MQDLRTDTGPSSPYWGEKEQSVSALVPLMTGTTLSHNFGILSFEGNPASHVKADASGSMSSAPYG